MILTLYYMASTCMQSWRSNSMKNTFLKLLGKNTSVVLYKERTLLDMELLANYDSLRLLIRGITSEYCCNKSKAHLLDLWCYKLDKRGCSVLPVQIVNISSWIRIPDNTTYFPIKCNKNADIIPSQKVSILLEASILPSDLASPIIICELENYGIPIAWTASEYFAIILETDIDHLTKFSYKFMSNNLYLSVIMEIIRLETVNVTGSPCELLHSGRIPILNYTLQENNQYGDKIYHNSSEGKFFDYPDKTFHTQMIRNVAKATEKLLLSSNNSLDLDYPPITVVKSGFVKPEATICFNQLLLPINNIVKTGSLTNGPAAIYNTRYLQTSTDEIDEKSCSGSICTAETISLTGSTERISNSICHHGEKKTGKPPNIIVFSESSSSVENIKTSLNNVLRKHRYTVYSLSLNDMLHSPWIQQTSLLIICGNVTPSLKPMLLKYLLNYGGQLMCVCSNMLGLILPTFQTVEVRPDEVVSFSYGKWDHITLLHHIFCYQPSPKSSKFSVDESPSNNSPSPTVVPHFIELKDPDSNSHTLEVKVLASEETWQTPTLLFASAAETGGKALFSQVHLELDPPEDKTMIYDLKVRLELLSDLLSTYLGLDCDLSRIAIRYESAYFLGRHERKLAFLKTIAQYLKTEDELPMRNIILKFCGKNTSSITANNRLLPVKIFDCPHNFSTLLYFDNLRTENLGRLIVYSDIMTSSMDILNGPPLEHGFAAICRQQTAGVGRSGNSWISPDGCAMFSIQLHIPLNSPLGQKLSLLQHIISLSIVSAICSQPGYEYLKLGLKWPNDIYANGVVKIGGLIVTSNNSNNVAVCNAGCGLNLNNSQPTTCVNDIIDHSNKIYNTKLPKISLEKYFAIVFTELEKLMKNVDERGIDEIFDLYYKYWLHDNAEVKITKADGTSQSAVIIGLDEFGFLKVKNDTGHIFSVQPDGNTFDMLEGLIAPK